MEETEPGQGDHLGGRPAPRAALCCTAVRHLAREILSKAGPELAVPAASLVGLELGLALGVVDPEWAELAHGELASLARHEGCPSARDFDPYELAWALVHANNHSDGTAPDGASGPSTPGPESS